MSNRSRGLTTNLKDHRIKSIAKNTAESMNDHHNKAPVQGNFLIDVERGGRI